MVGTGLALGDDSIRFANVMEDTMKRMISAAALALAVAAFSGIKAEAQSRDSNWDDRVGQVSGRPDSRQSQRVESRSGSYWGDRVGQVSGRRVVVRQPARTVYRPSGPVYRNAPRVLVVDQIHQPGKWFKRHRNARVVTVWYDRDRAQYYDAYRPGLREVEIYRVNGRYFDRYPASHYRSNGRDRDRGLRPGSGSGPR